MRNDIRNAPVFFPIFYKRLNREIFITIMNKLRSTRYLTNHFLLILSQCSWKYFLCFPEIKQNSYWTSGCYWTDRNRANTENIRIGLVFVVLAQWKFLYCIGRFDNIKANKSRLINYLYIDCIYEYYIHVYWLCIWVLHTCILMVCMSAIYMYNDGVHGCYACILMMYMGAYTCTYHPYTQSIYMHIAPIYTINIHVYSTQIHNRYIVYWLCIWVVCTCILIVHMGGIFSILIVNQYTCIYHPYRPSIYMYIPSI
jgi:hypothetical protein